MLVITGPSPAKIDVSEKDRSITEQQSPVVVSHGVEVDGADYYPVV